MAYFKANTSFTKKSDSALALFSDEIVRSMTDNPNFAHPSPELNDVREAQISFASAIPDKNSRNMIVAAAKNELRNTLIGLLNSLAQYVTATANGNRAILLTSGFEASKERTPAGDLTPPQNVRIQYGLPSGSLYLICERVKNAFSFETQRKNGEGDWVGGPVSPRSKIIMDGLTPGNRYDFQVRAIGTAGPSDWSGVGGVIAL